MKRRKRRASFSATALQLTQEQIDLITKQAGAHLGRTVREKVTLNWISNNKNAVRAALGGQTIALLPRNRRKLVGIACEQIPHSPSIAGERR